MGWIKKTRDPKWHDITALLDPTVVSAASGVRVRRKSDRIEYMVGTLTLSKVGIILPWGSLPAGYRPLMSQYGRLGTSAGASAEITVNTGGGLVINGATVGQSYRGSFVVWTDAAQPATHPGTVVT